MNDSRTVPGCSDLPKIQLTSTDGATAEVYLHGAHVTSWKPASGGERLFMSDTALFKEGTAIRGGVPVIFPQFAGFGPLPKHGFARNTAWKVVSTSADSATLCLRDTAATRAIWDHAFQAELSVRIGGEKLELKLRIANTGTAAFTFTAALHTYLNISDIAAASVEGLRGLTYLDEVTTQKHEDLNACLTFSGDVDRVYLQGGLRELTLHDSQGLMKVSSTGFTDAVIWNPGAVTGGKLADLETDGYKGFVCIEAAVVESPVELVAGAHWQGSQVLLA